MIDQKSIVGVAGNLKRKLVNRGNKIGELVSRIATARAGMGKRVNPERLNTIEEELEFAISKQSRDALVYATLRWVLGLTNDIDPEDLELDK